MIFRYDSSVGGWIKEAELTVSDAGPLHRFGAAVGISGDIAVASTTPDLSGLTSAAYVFRFDGSTWVQESQFCYALPCDHLSNSIRALAISGDAVIAQNYSGPPKVFRFDPVTGEWGEESSLTASGGPFSPYRTLSVAIAGDVALVGDDGDAELGEDAGAAFVFRYDGETWIHEAKLLASDGQENQAFGSSVAIDGDIAVIGARCLERYAFNPGYCPGWAYVFRFDGQRWAEVAKLASSDGAPYDSFGAGVAVSGNTAVVGAPGDDDFGEDSGSVYVFNGLSEDCSGQGTLDLCDDCNRNGVADDCDLLYGTSNDANGNNIPDDCEDCNGNGIPDEFDIATGFSNDCNANGVPDECDTADGTSMDCQLNQVPDECEVPPLDPTKPDCNGNLIPDACEADCQPNGIPDDCDIADDASLDQNGNMTPDLCEFDCVAVETAKVVAADAGAFGLPLSISGDVAVFDITPSSAYVYRFNGTDWLTEAELTPSDYVAGEMAVVDVSVSGNAVLLGTLKNAGNGYANRSASAYVFRFDGVDWVEEAKLTSSDVEEFDYFGFSVAISGEVAIVSAPRDGVNGGYCHDPPQRNCTVGSAYVFRFDGSTWIEEAKLMATDGASWRLFGTQVAIFDGVAVVSERWWGTGPSTYVFRNDGSAWRQEAELPKAYALAVSTDRILIGAPVDDDLGTVYVYHFEGMQWRQQTQLFASDGKPWDNFGISVDLDGDVAVVGAFDVIDKTNGSNINGAAYLFRFNGSTWVEEAKLTASDGAADEEFGSSVALAGSTVLIGAPYAIVNGQNSGAVYSFDRVSNCYDDYTLDVCAPVDADPGALDVGDYQALYDCLAGPEIPPDPNDPECLSACLVMFDFDDDGDTDLADVAVFQRMFTVKD